MTAILIGSLCFGCGACDRGFSGPAPDQPEAATAAEQGGGGAPAGDDQDEYAAHRKRMVDTQLAARDINDERVLKAMLEVPRHRFMPDYARGQAYADHAVPIGEGQTISQPYVVAFMTQAAKVGPGDQVLEIGTGSGYQAAVLAELGSEVYSIEIIPELSKRAGEVLDALGYDKVHLKIGDGYRGWPEKAPFDAIIVTAAPPEVPQPLIDQLAKGGRMVIPVGDLYQNLEVIERTEGGVTRRKVLPVRFVPMTGEAQKRR